jgi:hypothetical protein
MANFVLQRCESNLNHESISTRNRGWSTRVIETPEQVISKIAYFASLKQNKGNPG